MFTTNALWKVQLTASVTDTDVNSGIPKLSEDGGHPLQVSVSAFLQAVVPPPQILRRDGGSNSHVVYVWSNFRRQQGHSGRELLGDQIFFRNFFQADGHYDDSRAVDIRFPYSAPSIDGL